jgi:hypothetical protein
VTLCPCRPTRSPSISSRFRGRVSQCRISPGSLRGSLRRIRETYYISKWTGSGRSGGRIPGSAGLPMLLPLRL